MCPCADNVRGLKSAAEAEARCKPWVGERCKRGEAVRGSARGVLASANAGISSAKTDENSVRRKPKGS